jgi:hypothetical protein
LLIIFSGLIAQSADLRADPLVAELASRILIVRGSELDCLPLCNSFLSGPPFPTENLLCVMSDYVLRVLRGGFPSYSIKLALHFVALCLDNLPSLDFSPFLEFLGHFIPIPDIGISTEVVRILLALPSVDPSLFDFLIARAESLDFLRLGSLERAFLLNVVLLVFRYRETLVDKSESIIQFLRRLSSSSCFDVSYSAVSTVLLLLPMNPEFSEDLCEFLLAFYDQDVNTRRIFGIFLYWFEIGGEILSQCMFKLSPLYEEVLDFLWASNYPEHRLFLKYLEVILDSVE